MARKRLADLVRQEAQKASDSEVTTAENESSKGTETATSSTESPSSEKEPASEQPSPQQVELEETITKLKKALEKVRDNERVLQERNLELQAQLDDRNQFIHQLKDEIQKSDLKGKLEKAQEAALQLSEANTRLIEEIKTLKEENETLKVGKQPKKEFPKAPLVHRPERAKSQPVNTDDFSKSTWLL